MNNTQYVSPKESAYCPECKTHPQQIRTRNHAERFCSNGHTFTLKQSREAERVDEARNKESDRPPSEQYSETV